MPLPKLCHAKLSRLTLENSNQCINSAFFGFEIEESIKRVDVLLCLRGFVLAAMWGGIPFFFMKSGYNFGASLGEVNECGKVGFGSLQAFGASSPDEDEVESIKII
jgi:hypothetical protein